jgi:hypothetical protein
VKKRRQHYVWQHYLSAWVTGGTLACMQGENIFRTSPINVAVESDFYRLVDLTPNDIMIIDGLIQRSHPLSHGLHRQWLHSFRTLFDARNKYLASGRRDAHAERVIDETFNNLEEDLHEQIEARGAPYLAALKTGDATFMSSIGSFSDFMSFLAVQYFRTRKIESAVHKAWSSIPIMNPANGWPLLRHIFAINVAGAFILVRANVSVSLLTAPSGCAFITGDQPVINTHAAGRELDAVPDELEFYYPVSPATAVLIGMNPHGGDSKSVQLGREDVVRLNRSIAAAAHRQIYAADASAFADVEPVFA